MGSGADRGHHRRTTFVIEPRNHRRAPFILCLAHTAVKGVWSAVLAVPIGRRKNLTRVASAGSRTGFTCRPPLDQSIERSLSATDLGKLARGTRT